MYQFSRAIYREIARDIHPIGHQDCRGAHEDVLRACEATVERLTNDRHYFRRPARTLFNDIRLYFPMRCQERVWNVITSYVTLVDQWLESQPIHGVDVNGQPLECRATTRRGTACQRVPLPHNGYCPSHQHLAETEDLEIAGPLEPVAA
jgi:hypothetical protein